MLQYMKLYFLFHLVRNNGKRLTNIIFMFIFFIFNLYISSDFLEVVSNEHKLYVLLFKWIVSTLILSLIVFNASKIYKKSNRKKDKTIFSSDASNVTLYTKGELIRKKYKRGDL